MVERLRCLVADDELFSLTILLLLGLIALFVEMLLDSSEAAADADVVFEDVFKIDSLLDAV